MVKRIIFSALAVSLLSLVPLAQTVYASTASIFVSPSSSSVTKGDTVTVQVRVDSGSDPMDTAQARIHYDSSRLKYVSHSAGSFPQVVTNSTSNSFEFVGAILGGSTSGNRVIFSITFKTTNSGTASLSLSNAQAAHEGSPLSISTSGGAVKISEPPSKPKPPSDSSPKPSPGPSPSPPPSEEEASPPELTGDPKFETTQSTITATLKTDKPSEVELRYWPADHEDDAKTIHKRNAKTDHEIVIGEDQPLLAGTKYVIEITLTDEDGNRANPRTFRATTKGVTYKVKIVDTAGQPLTNHPVKLFSDPLEATTDNDGFATFDNVPPGEHTLVFEIDGITVRHPVLVAQPLAQADESDDAPASTDTVQLPFQLAAHTETPSGTSWYVIPLAAVGGAGLMFVLQQKRVRGLVSAALHHVRQRTSKPQSSQHGPNQD